MSEREVACWIVGGLLALLIPTIVAVLWEITIKAEAWVQVAREIGEGLASLGGG